MTSLPLSLQITALIASLAWPLYQLYLALVGPSLTARLTRDIFFRFIPQGECLFLRPVLIAEHGNLLISKITAHLKRTGPGAEKGWDLEFLKFGEAINSDSQVESTFCYQSSGPIRFLAKGIPLQAVYLARPHGYGEAYAGLVKELNDKLVPIKIAASKEPADSEILNTLANQVLDLSKEYAEKLFDKIQLEAGKYQIHLEIEYRGISGLGSYINRSTPKTVLEFEIESNAREHVRGSLLSAIHKSSINFVTDSTSIVIFPEYNPINVTEKVV
jgi:hypothetical protein